MDRIHFEIANVAGINAACCIWINGRSLTQIVYGDLCDVPDKAVCRYWFLPVCSVQPVPDYWLGCAARQADRWVMLLHEPIEETGDSSWIATQVTAKGNSIRWSRFIRKVGLHSGRGEIWQADIGPFRFSRAQYEEAFRCLRQREHASPGEKQWHKARNRCKLNGQ
jgi:hypothetical protein